MSRGLRRPIAIAALAAIAVFPSAFAARAQGVSEAEHLRVTPPMPRLVRVERDAGGAAIVTWAPPLPSPDGALAYERGVSRYRIYRGPFGAERAIGETRARRFVDRSPQAGEGYVVTALHGAGQESGRPDPVKLDP